MASLEQEMAENAAAIEQFLDGYLDNADHLVLMGTPSRLLAAMRHGVLNGGKRLRPYLVRVVAGIFGVAPEACIRAAAALELVHSYSLVHDDLPDMDNDRLRRGKPSVWAAFDPATAILAGDALLTTAFDLLADEATHPDPAARIALVRSLSFRAGPVGMVGGQVLDLAAEGQSLAIEDVTAIHQMKTAELISSAMEMGAILAGERQYGAISLCGYHAGLAFQVADDILDATATSGTLGKTAGKDAEQQKATTVAILGLDGARSLLDDCVADAILLLEDYGTAAERLRELIRYFASRGH